jgi:hypothetical protein
MKFLMVLRLLTLGRGEGLISVYSAFLGMESWVRPHLGNFHYAGLLPSFEEQEMIQSRTGPDYSVEVRVGSTIEDRN